MSLARVVMLSTEADVDLVAVSLSLPPPGSEAGFHSQKCSFQWLYLVHVLGTEPLRRSSQRQFPLRRRISFSKVLFSVALSSTCTRH
jgi:hypothetical protein